MAHSLPKGRIPTRPLSYAEKDKRFPQEVLIDYENCRIYVSDSNGNLHDTIVEIAEILKENPDIFSSVVIQIEGIGDVTLQGAFDNVFQTINNITTQVLDKIGKPGGIAELDSNGKVVASQLPDMNYNKRFQNIGGAFDFNNITDDGIHMRIGVATNSPYGEVSDQSFAIHVYKYDNMHLHQVAYDMKNNFRAERSLIYGAWSKWVLKNSLDIYPNNSISDLNTFETPGILTLTSSVTNIPPGEGFYAVVYNFCGAINGYLVQYYFAAGSRKTWVRSRVDGVWEAWRQVADSTNALMYGNGIGEAGKFDNSTDAPTATNYLRYNGQFRATKVFGMYFSDSADYAESYNVVGEFNKGDLICLDTDGSFVRNTKALNTKVLGFVSTEPGSVFGGTDGAPIALAGRVPVNTYGIVNSGDYLVGSYEPGCVMSWDIENSPRGSIVGMALEGNDKGNKSQVMAFVVRM